MLEFEIEEEGIGLIWSIKAKGFNGKKPTELKQQTGSGSFGCCGGAVINTSETLLWSMPPLFPHVT